jgi:hypothetical protein
MQALPAPGITTIKRREDGAAFICRPTLMQIGNTRPGLKSRPDTWKPVENGLKRSITVGRNRIYPVFCTSRRIHSTASRQARRTRDSGPDSLDHLAQVAEDAGMGQVVDEPGGGGIGQAGVRFGQQDEDGIDQVGRMRQNSLRIPPPSRARSVSRILNKFKSFPLISCLYIIFFQQFIEAFVLLITTKICGYPF